VRPGIGFSWLLPFRHIIKVFGVDALMKRFLLLLAVALLLAFRSLVHSGTNARLNLITHGPIPSPPCSPQQSHNARIQLDHASQLRILHLLAQAPPATIRYSDYVMVHLLFEAARDAGFWNMQWNITDQPPNSDRVWRQWRSVNAPSFIVPTAIAECDELSALYAFLVERAGVRAVGLFWPYPNHTVAVWMPRLAAGPPIRIIVPTSQIFLTDADTFDTRKFDPWRQKTIYEYTRRDVPDFFVLPKPLFDFFIQQLEKYAGTSESALQQIRSLRSSVFSGSLTPDQAAREALRIRSGSSFSREDLAAFSSFATDLRSVNSR
jgi:hypothetical protein